MKYKFWKYQGTGNDFIFLDGREDVSAVKDNTALIKRLCDRRFGIGADGFIILETQENSDFRMLYYNSDGSESTMCGNGGRCAMAFAKLSGFVKDEAAFEAIDGRHDARINVNGNVELGMIDVQDVKKLGDRTYQIDTGSPHYIYFLREGEKLDIVQFGKKIRYSEAYKKEGINVNAVKLLDKAIEVSTYERGVEDETLSCGTGVTACAIAYNEFFPKNDGRKVSISTKGGKLEVSFEKGEGGYREVVLSGPATFVYEGQFEI